MITITERTHDIIFNVFKFVYCVVVVLALYAANPAYFTQQLHAALMSIVSGVAALAHLVGVCVCVLYIITFSLLLVLQICPSPMPARYVKAGFYKARRWVAATYSSWQQRRRRARRVRFVQGEITEVIWIASHSSYTMEERLGMFSSGEVLRAMQRRNNIEDAYERSLGRVVEEDEFYLDSCGRQWHPAHAHHGMMIQSSRRLIHPVRHSAKQVAVVAVVAVTGSNEKADDFNDVDVDSSSKCSTTSTSHDEPVAHIDLSEDCSSDNEDSSVVGTCGAFAGDGDADVPSRTDGDSNSNSKSNCSTRTTDVEPLVNVEFMEDCSSYHQDSSSVGSSGSSAFSNDADVALRKDGDSNSNCSTSMSRYEPLVNFDFIEDFSSDDEDSSSSVGSRGTSAGCGDADVPVQSKPPRTTELPSSTVPCAQPSQGCRARPFLARKAKEGLKRYI